MEDDIEKSKFQVKAIFPEEPLYIVSDGTKLYRVFQNIIDNALVVIKNIASYKMNFTSEEILQRFNRGTTEGSGLGLAIAESFSKLCGGDFKVEIDGDLFKVLIGFRTVESMDEKVEIFD
ncbi:MAG: hypothetical protein GX053_01565 [Tissierella sp.]|nr:hypothetical protein [Tissierella sp.]